MANILPFRGFRYNTEKISDLGAVMAPPYDSISADEQKALYDMHENNSVRLVYGMAADDDTDTNNKYTRAAGYLNDWIEKEIIIQDEKPAIYMYEQIITINETQFATKGFIAMLELEEFSNGNIMPCEETITSSKKDRYSLLEATKSNVSMINCMYMENEKILAHLMNDISDKTPDVHFTTGDNIEQNLWIITDEETIGFIQKNMADKRLVITDGQNRYETCLEYAQKIKAENPELLQKDNYNYILTLLTNSSDDSVVQLPVHRLVKCPKGLKEDYFIATAQDRFKVEKIIVDYNAEELADTMKKQIFTPRKENRIAFYCGGEYFYRLTLLDHTTLKTAIPDKSPAYRSLDVTVLNHLLLDEIMNITPETYHDRVTFTKNIVKGINAVRNGEYQCLFVINPSNSQQIRDVAIAGEKMPERSICIFPKPATGIVFNIRK